MSPLRPAAVAIAAPGVPRSFPISPFLKAPKPLSSFRESSNVTVTDRVIIFDLDIDRSATARRDARRPGFPNRAMSPPVGGESRPLAGSIRASPWSWSPTAPPGRFAGLARAARAREIATVGVIDPVDDPIALVDRVRDYDRWVASDRAVERAAGSCRPSARTVRCDLVRRRLASSIDARFLALVVHDLRTPLNVIGLTIRAIAQSSPDQSAEFEEDLTFLQENARQIEKMLSQLADYCRLLEAGVAALGRRVRASPVPRRFPRGHPGAAGGRVPGGPAGTGREQPGRGRSRPATGSGWRFSTHWPTR